jgi:hypothetical protein
MTEIIGDDYPTYEDSVKMTLAEQEREVSNSNLGRLLQENHDLRKDVESKSILLSQALHRLACIEHDIKIVRNHINRCCKGSFFEPSLNEDGSVFADEAWHNITNIEIACDLNSNESLDWESRVKNKLSREEEENMYQQIT